jgi:hypothetical protein
MRPDRIVVTSPALDDDLSLSKREEDFAIQQFIPQTGVEALDEAVLPGTSRCDVCGAGTNRRDPVLDSFGDELRTVIRSNVLRYAAQDEQVGQGIDHIDGLQFAINPDRQAFVSELVDDVEHAELLSLMGSVLDKVVGPDMVWALGAKPDAGAVIEPETAAFGLFLGNLQPLAPPQPLDPLVVHPPTRISQHRCNLAIAIAAIAPGQFDQIGYQAVFMLTAPRDSALCRAMLAERRTGAALGDRQNLPDMVDTRPAARGA